MISAGAFLGITAIIFTAGYDGVLYAVSLVAAYPLIMFVISERLRNLGQYTFADVVSFRLEQTPIRITAATGTIVITLMYITAQMVGAGKVIEILFGISYTQAVIIVGILIMFYVTFGGMLATTWLQIVKAVMLLLGVTFMAFMVLKNFGFSFEQLLVGAGSAHAKGLDILKPGLMYSNPIDSISLAIGLMFGTAGLPHMLMRFFTVKDAKEARKSVVYATGFIGYFYVLIICIGFGAIVMVGKDSQFLTGAGGVIGGANMVAVHLSKAVGGDLFFGFIAAVAFATILAVVSGLAVSGATAVAHDLYACVLRKGQATPKEEMRVSRIATIIIGIASVMLGLLFESQNIAFLSGLVLAIAASVNFPVLFLAMFWRGLTTRGAIVGSLTGLLSAIILLVLSPVVWVKLFGYDEAIFPYSNPALFSMPLAFLGSWVASVTDNSKTASAERDRFPQQFIRSMTGIGASAASSH
ncbi:Cation/acetate symporter ActP [compost metagenome]